MSDDKDRILKELEKKNPDEEKVVTYIEHEIENEPEIQVPVEEIGRNNGFNNQGINNINSNPVDTSSVSRQPLTGLTPSAPVNQPNTGSGLERQSLNKGNEQAPDIGKDYGKSMPTQPNIPKPVDSNQGGNAVPRESAMQNGIPQGNATPTLEQQPDESLPKKDGLEKKDADKQDDVSKKSDDDSKKQDGKDTPQGEQKTEPAVSDKKGDGSDLKNKKPTDDKGEKEKSGQQPDGNGYGALKNKQNGSANDISSNARKNLAHNNRIKKGNSSSSSTKKTTTTKTGSSSNSSKPSLTSKLRNGLNKLKNRKKPKGKVGAKGAGKIAKDALSFLVRHPFIAIIIGVIILLFILLLFEEMEGKSSRKGGTHCTYSLKGVVASGEIELSGLKVELINCDGTESNYTVLETIDFEKYVLGVALAEIGPDSPDEAIKTQIVAARNFALTRNSGMCPGNQDNCFYGYNASTGKIRMRACEADQVYWDYEKDIYRQDRGSISLYSPEVTSGSLWKSALDDTRKQEVLALAEEVKGKVLVDTSGNVVSTNYVASTSDQFISLANEGKTYDEILATVYTDSDGFGDAYCSSYGNIDYGDYVLSSDGHEILHQPLDSFLSSQGTSLEEFNSLISANVQDAGYGTRAGVVAAAVTLIAELGNNYNVKVPYYWGGGHYDGVVDGALGYWGSTECHTYANGQSYNYCGLDCSGVVPWAIKNGGFNISQMLAGDFQGLPGAQRVSLRNDAVLEPGDLLESSGHIVLVVGIEDGNYICAEASGNSVGVLFTRRPFNSSGYWGVKMDGFYDTHARSQ